MIQDLELFNYAKDVVQIMMEEQFPKVKRVSTKTYFSNPDNNGVEDMPGANIIDKYMDVYSSANIINNIYLEFLGLTASILNDKYELDKVRIRINSMYVNSDRRLKLLENYIKGRLYSFASTKETEKALERLITLFYTRYNMFTPNQDTISLYKYTEKMLNKANISFWQLAAQYNKIKYISLYYKSIKVPNIRGLSAIDLYVDNSFEICFKDHIESWQALKQFSFLTYR